MIMVTLKMLEKVDPCKSSADKLLAYLGKTEADDEEFPLLTVLESNGLDDALWCTRCLPEYDKEWRLFAVWCARKVEHLMTDERSRTALDVAERFANGKATKKELKVVRDNAFVAVKVFDLNAIRSAGWAATCTAASTATSAATSAAWAAAWATASDAGDDGDGVIATAVKAQEEEFRRVIS